MLRFSKPKNRGYGDQIEAFPYAFQGFTFGKILSLLAIPEEPHHNWGGLLNGILRRHLEVLASIDTF